jgi:sec-independent protein translocase protein TatA
MYSGTLLEFLNMGGGEMMLIMVAVLLLFGGKKLPELARGLGKGIREFKDASDGVKREIHRNINSVTNETEQQAIDENYAAQNPSEQEAPLEPIVMEEEKVNLEEKKAAVKQKRVTAKQKKTAIEDADIQKNRDSYI